MPLNLFKPSEGDVGWAADVNQNFTEVEDRLNQLGTLANQNADAVAITGGSLSGITDLAVADGGTGASSAAGAQENLEVPPRTRTISTTAPLTGGGDLSADRTISLGTQDANTVLAGPTSGSAAAPGFRALAADDVPALAASKITSGTLDAARMPTIEEDKGGTGQTTYATGDLLYASGANTLAKRAAGTAGDVLTMAGGVPTWAAPAGGGGGGAWELVETQTLVSAAQPVTFSGLDGDTDRIYMIQAAYEGGPAPFLRINGDSAANYAHNRLGLFAGATNLESASGQTAFAPTTGEAASGVKRLSIVVSCGGAAPQGIMWQQAAGNWLVIASGTWIGGGANVISTSLDSPFSAFSAGSVFSLYKAAV